MWIGFLLLLVYLVWAAWIWRTAPPVVSEEETQKESFRYYYTTTPVRRFVVMNGSCLLFAILFWVITYSVADVIWRKVFLRFFSDDGAIHIFLVMLIAIAVISLMRLPKFKQLTYDVCCFFQRLQYFPMLPSIREESLIEQLSSLPMGVVPKEIEERLLVNPIEVDSHYETEMVNEFRRLEVIYKELEQLAATHKGIVKRFYFGSDWELIQNKFNGIQRLMHSDNIAVSKSLGRKIHGCLYLCYSLLTRVIIETSDSPEESKALFKQYGFDVDVTS
ncbi:hypothetical protein [Aurantivibrio plasticivorans]